jgi:hypothetical protein
VIATVPEVTKPYAERAALRSPGGKDYVGTWEGPPTTSLEITIESLTDKGMLGLARSNLKQRLVGPSKSAAGIGDKAYESKGADAVEIKTDVGSTSPSSP